MTTEYQKEFNYAEEKRTILIVDDNDLNREILESILEKDYNVLQAENGKVCLEIMQEKYNRISTVILDVQMPVMNGYEVLMEVQNDPLLKEIPIIVVTGNQGQEEEEKCLSLGASDFITKPYNNNIVLSRLKSIIRLKESASTLLDVEFDQESGIYTRQAFFHHANKILKRYTEVNYTVGITDIEDCKNILEAKGYKEANELLRKNVNDICTSLPIGSIFGRYSDNIYVCMIPHEKIRGINFEELKGLSFVIDGITYNLKIGAIECIDHNIPIEINCKHALSALNTIRHQYDKFVAVFDEEMLKRTERETAIENSMEKALKNEEFKVYYQPKHDTKTGKLVGAEALIRWISPKYGFMSPGEFIPIFESTGFVTEADYYVWIKTCNNQKKWQEMGLNIVPISVNCSRKDFSQPTFLNRWLEPLKETHVPTEKLHIEITESFFSDNMDQIAEILNSCRNAGIEIELDDFGSGYSSLNALGSLPLDVVKLDMSFMRKLDDPRRIRVMTACVHLSQSLNLKTVSEGVETEAQREIVNNMGVDMIQGYYFSKPLPEKDFEEYIRKNNS